MSFPCYSDWLTTVIHPRDRSGGGSPWCFETPEWHRAYANKYAIARAVKATSVLEVGVRYGYSAHAFLMGGATRYLGIDADSPEHNYMGEPTCDWALAMLDRNCPWCVTSLIRADTAKTDPTAGVLSMFDLVHIDGDHSYHGATRDMERGWRLCNRAMLVDDYTRDSAVRDAVEQFAKVTGALLFLSPSGTGEALFLK